MSDWSSFLSDAIKGLEAEETDLQNQLDRVREAIRSISGSKGSKIGSKGTVKRKFTKAGREAIGRAAKKRWAAWRKAKKAKSKKIAKKSRPKTKKMKPQLAEVA